MKRVLVTGAAGYLGSVLCGKLLEKGFSVIAADSRQDAETILSGHLHRRAFEFVSGDVTQKAVMEPLVQRTDVIIPLAALVGAPLCDREPARAQAVNFEAVRLLNSLRRPEQKVIFPMTNNGYQPGESPLADEETPWSEGSLYTRSKKQSEELLLASGNAVSLRLASLYGVSPSMRWDLLVHTFIQLAVVRKKIEIFEQEFRRSFLHVQDAAEAFCFFANPVHRSLAGIFNVAQESANISKKQLALRIQTLYPETAIHAAEHFSKDPDARDFFISTEKIRRAGFEPKRPLETGISEILESLLRENAVTA